MDSTGNCVHRQWFLEVLLSPCSDFHDRISAANAVLPEALKIPCWFLAMFHVHRDIYRYSESFNIIVVSTVASQQEDSNLGLSLCSLHVPVYAFVLSRYSGFLPQSKDMTVRLIEDAKWIVEVTVSVHGCFSCLSLWWSRNKLVAYPGCTLHLARWQLRLAPAPHEPWIGQGRYGKLINAPPAISFQHHLLSHSFCCLSHQLQYELKSCMKLKVSLSFWSVFQIFWWSMVNTKLFHEISRLFPNNFWNRDGICTIFN